MANPTLSAQTKDPNISAKNVLRNKQLPLIYYGKGIENVQLTCDYEEFRKLYRTAGENTIVDLVIDGKDHKNIIIHNVQRDPVYDQFIHIDLLNVKMDEEITAMIPVILEGQAPAVKELAGTLVQGIDEVEVRCLPKDLPHEIKGNVDKLIDFHVSLHVSDLEVPANVEILNDPEQTIATVSAPKEEKPEEETSEEGGEKAETTDSKASQSEE